MFTILKAILSWIAVLFATGCTNTIYHKQVIVEGGLTKKEISDSSQEIHYNQVRHCYEQYLLKGCRGEGEEILQLEIDPGGVVTRTSFLKKTYGDDDFRSCLKSYIMKWKFPMSKDLKPTKVSWPLKFMEFCR